MKGYYSSILVPFGVSGCLILSTGKTDPEDKGAPSEASVMKAELLAYGVPETCIHLEENSKTTEEVDIHLIYHRQDMKDRIRDERDGYNALKKGTYQSRKLGEMIGV